MPNYRNGRIYTIKSFQTRIITDPPRKSCHRGCDKSWKEGLGEIETKENMSRITKMRQSDVSGACQSNRICPISQTHTNKIETKMNPNNKIRLCERGEEVGRHGFRMRSVSGLCAIPNMKFHKHHLLSSSGAPNAELITRITTPKTMYQYFL